MFGLLRSDLLQYSALRTWNYFINIANYCRFKFIKFTQPEMPRSRRRHHSRSRSRSHSHDRDREVKRRRVDSPDNHNRRSVSVEPLGPAEQSPAPELPIAEEHEQQMNISSEELINKKIEDNISPKKVMSPALLQKKLESEKKREARQKEREEREKKRQEERMKLKLEKDEQRRKEKEEREELKRAKEEQKREQKRKEREEREEQKRKEREEKDLKRQQELDEKNRDKKKKEELAEKEKAAFVNFFVPRKSTGGGAEVVNEEPKCSYAFMPFEVKSDMRLAPHCRRNLSDAQKNELVDKLLSQQFDQLLYLDEIKTKQFGKCHKTWPVEDEDDVKIIEDSADIGEHFEEEKRAERMRAKLLKFHENRRPAYFGTWRKKSKYVTSRKPYARDLAHFDYDVDSDDDWEEEEPGESLHGSDDEDKANESDDYEVDNEFFVPHGYLSNDEEIDETEDNMSSSLHVSPETQKEKLKILQMEFDQEMKSKTERIKPRLMGCIWEKKHAPKVQDAIQHFFADRTIIVTGTITIQKRDLFAKHNKTNTVSTTPNQKKTR